MAAALWLGLLAVVVVAVVFAPVITVGWCADAVVGGDSACGSMQTSLLGVESNFWLWLGVTLIVIVATGVVLRRRRADPQ